MDCPDCGSARVTSEVGPDQAIGTSLETAVFRAGEGDSVHIVRQCWDCEWRETRTITVDSVTTEDGDEEVIEQRRLVSQLLAAARSIEDRERLRSLLDDARDEAERQNKP